VTGFVLFALQIAAEIMRRILVLRGREVPPREGTSDVGG
jgi:TRAP-type mannitol/chloroaromatic compound transport system permease small subunit